MLTTDREADKVNDYASEYIDVRDVADAFVASLQTESAGGERFILDAGAFTYQNLCQSPLLFYIFSSSEIRTDDALYAGDPSITDVPRGNPKAPKFNFAGPFCNPERAISVLGLKDFRSLSACAMDSYKSFRERGF